MEVTPSRYDKQRAYQKRRRDEIKTLFLDHFEVNSCVDCGESDPLVLEFDHFGDKLFNLGDAANRGYAIDKIKAEIAKCHVRCANCHRRKTYAERGYTHRSRP